MSGNANRIVLAVAALLVAAVLLLVVGAGSCSPRGGGGSAAPTPADSADDATSPQTGTAPSAEPASDETQGIPAPSTGGAPGTASPATSPAAGQPLPDEPADSATLEELMAELQTSYAPVGSNPRSAATSANVLSVQDVHARLAQRGFADVHLYADFDLSGTYIGRTELDPSSTERYPSYYFPYLSAQDVVWYVYNNDGHFIAVPRSYLNDPVSQQVIVFEDDYVIQYDGIKNEYSDFSHDDLASVKDLREDSIDAFTLDQLTPGTLNAR